MVEGDFMIEGDWNRLLEDVDMGGRVNLASEREAFFARIRKYRLPSFEEVDRLLDNLRSKARRKDYYQDIVRRYSFYFAEVEEKNLKYIHDWEEEHKADAITFEAAHSEEISRTQRYNQVALNAYNRIRMLFATTDPDFIPSKILWRGEHPREQITELIREWSESPFATIHLNQEPIEEYINSRFSLGRAEIDDKGDYIIWNDTNENLLLWINCLVEEELLNIELSVGRLVDDYSETLKNRTYTIKSVPEIAFYIGSHFLKYKNGVHFFSQNSLQTTYQNLRERLHDIRKDDRKHEGTKKAFDAISSSVRQIASK